MLHIIKGLTYSLIIVFVVSCGGGGGGTVITKINSFKASAVTISEGSSVNLTADFINGTASINNGVGPVSSNVPVPVTPTTRTTYTLTLTNDIGASITSSVTVNVIPVATPLISSFVASETTITAGASVNLTAIFDENGSASINNGVGAVASNVANVVTPSISTTYTLTVTPTTGSPATSTVTVEVVPVTTPLISSFVPSETTITEGASVDLTAVFENGTGSIDYGVGAVISEQVVAVTPADTTTYTLTVTPNVGDPIESFVTVTVVPVTIPIISSFVASATAIAEGSSINLTAVFENGTASIDNGVGAVASNVAELVTPNATTTYTLTVTPTSGDAITSSVTVHVLPTYNIFPPGFFEGSYSHNFTFSGSDTDLIAHTAILDEVSGVDDTINGIKTINETLKITKSGGGTSGGLSYQYWTDDLNNLKYVGYEVPGDGSSATATASSVMPTTTYIGDSGTMGSYTRSDDSTFAITWQLGADTGSNAKYTTITVSKDDLGEFDYTAKVTSFINQAGTISKQIIIIIFHKESNRTLTLTSE